MLKVKTLFSFFIFVLFFSCDNKKYISFELTESNRIILNATVNGKSGRFFLDTGSSFSQFDCDFGNLDFSHKHFASFPFLDAREELNFYYLPEVIIDNVRLKSISEIARTTEDLRNQLLEPEGLDGVLGINVFAGFYTEISFSKDKIILHKKKPTQFEKSVPVNLESNYFCVSVDIDGKQAPFIIDTGAPGGIYFPPTSIRGKMKNEYVRILLPKRQNILVKTREVYLVKTNKISVFDDIFENKIIVTNSPWRFDANISTSRGMLGVEFLKNYDLLFDFTNLPFSTSALYYKNINAERDEKELFLSEETSERILASGIYSFYRTPEGITLGIIAGSVLNVEYGITEKTVITKIDGKPAQRISDAALREMDISKVKDFTVLERRERIIALN
ncbi:MAG: hypothetical protein LBG05_10635 [Treponema sp.]|jgi:hypothetical protein|nr:hypothetical protein [Treponema sp.]